MSKKIVALILLLPIVLMMTLFTAVNSVSLKVSIPVAKIQILGENFVSLDMDKQERYYVDYVIYPTVAVNKDVHFSVEQVGNHPLAKLEYKNGYIYPLEAGYANVYLTTADGGFRDNFQVVVKATKLKRIDCFVESNSMLVGESMQINTEFTPSTATNKALEYVSSNQNVLTVNDNGVITARAKGNACIIVRSLADQTIQDTIEISVNVNEIFTLARTQITTSNTFERVDITIDTTQYYTLGYQVYDSLGNSLDNVIVPSNAQNPFVDMGDGNFQFNFIFIDEAFYDTAVIKFVLTIDGESYEKTCTITRTEGFTAQFNSQEELFVEVDKTFSWKNLIEVSPADTKIEYSVNYSNDNLAINTVNYLAKANKMGITKATITLKDTQKPNQTIQLEKDVYIGPEEIYIKENVGSEYGIENVYTIGKYNAKGERVTNNISLFFGGEAEGHGFEQLKERITFETGTSQVVIENQSIKILDDSYKGVVDITAKLNVGDDLKVSQPFKVRCVGNGVEVDNFIDLHWATKNNKIVVLKDDVIDDFGKDKQGNNFYQGQNIDRLESTYDTQYYQNVGNINTSIITLLQFRADLYGNGHVINANNVTNVSDSDRFSGKALFNGPLNLVSMSDSGSSLVSVKAQDNVCFAVFENTTINNVELKGCTLQSTTSTYDLTDLDYVGTVVEVFGNNVNIEYSRINNGRTVLRAFGDEEDCSKTINVNVKNSVLSTAREFVVRIGSNLFKRDSVLPENTSNYQAPFLDENTSINFPAQQDYKNYDNEQKADYEQKYIKTFVNIENSVLKDSGIFCVGIDTHFAGPMLINAPALYSAFSELLAGWKDLSATSYGAKLVFNGDVRIYDWKNINNVDSSTIIENNAPDVEPYNLLKFNVKEMIEELDNTSMVYRNEKGEQFVHGGVVFFGGGNNYGVFEQKGESFKGLLAQGSTLGFEDYKISLKDVGKEFLESAAGNKPFYFSIYGANSPFTPIVQTQILNSNSAYACIYF